ncbi:hypothetical protein ACSJLP_24540 [Gordonia rhizosphera NBRC 16068]
MTPTSALDLMEAGLGFWPGRRTSDFYVVWQDTLRSVVNAFTAAR